MTSNVCMKTRVMAESAHALSRVQIQVASRLLPAAVVTPVLDGRDRTSGLPIFGGAKYGGTGSRAWSPPV